MNSEKRNISEDLRMIKRGSGIIKELSPGLLCLSLLNSLLSAIIPYISIYISAIIIDELVGKRNLHMLLMYVVIAVGGTLVMSVTSNLIMRLSSCRFCNTIIVFDHGQVVQMGSHDELLKDIGGKYYELWSAQAQYYQ